MHRQVSLLLYEDSLANQTATDGKNPPHISSIAEFWLSLPPENEIAFCKGNGIY